MSAYNTQIKITFNKSSTWCMKQLLNTRCDNCVEIGPANHAKQFEVNMFRNYLFQYLWKVGIIFFLLYSLFMS